MRDWSGGSGRKRTHGEERGENEGSTLRRDWSGGRGRKGTKWREGRKGAYLGEAGQEVETHTSPPGGLESNQLLLTPTGPS